MEHTADRSAVSFGAQTLTGLGAKPAVRTVCVSEAVREKSEPQLNVSAATHWICTPIWEEREEESFYYSCDALLNFSHGRFRVRSSSSR